MFRCYSIIANGYAVVDRQFAAFSVSSFGLLASLLQQSSPKRVRPGQKPSPLPKPRGLKKAVSDSPVSRRIARREPEPSTGQKEASQSPRTPDLPSGAQSEPQVLLSQESTLEGSDNPENPASRARTDSVTYVVNGHVYDRAKGTQQAQQLPPRNILRKPGSLLH